MRYRSLTQVTFVNVLGETKKIYPERLEELGNTISVFPKAAQMDLDSVAFKVFGPNAEFRTYRLRDQNIVKLLNYNFDEEQILEVDVGDVV